MTALLPCLSLIGSGALDGADGTWPARQIAEAKGWTYLSNGAFTVVLLSPDGGRVLKLTDSDAGAEATYDAAAALPDNPHFPRVYARLDFPGGGFAVETERLRMVYGADWSAWTSTTGCGQRTPPDLDAIDEGPMKDALSALVDRVKAAEQDGQLLKWDDHDGNVMVRPSDGHTVLTDILADWGRAYNCDKCGEVCDRYALNQVHDEEWCDNCCGEHAVHCRECGENHPKDGGHHVHVVDVLNYGWMNAADWHPYEYDVCNDGCQPDGFVEVTRDDQPELWNADLHAALTALQGLAVELETPSYHDRQLPLPLAA